MARIFPRFLVKICLLCAALTLSTTVLHYILPVDNLDLHPIRSEDLIRASATTEPPKVQCQPHKSVAFIKTHKTGSTTLHGPLQKFATKNNLTVLVSRMFDHIGWPYEFIPGVSSMKSDIPINSILNHMIYNKTTLSMVMDPSTKYITVIREPVSHLISCYNYFGLNDKLRLGQGVDAFRKFLSDPKKYDKNPDWLQNLIDGPKNDSHIRSSTRNLQSADLGLKYKHFDTPIAIRLFTKEIERDFELLLVTDRLDESLVLLRRLLCWKMEDIVYYTVNKWVNTGWSAKNLTEGDRERAREWSNVDTMLYDIANRQLNEKIAKQVNFQKEVTQFRFINHVVAQFCSNFDQSDLGRKNVDSTTVTQKLWVPSSEFHEGFDLDKKFCHQLTMREEDVTLFLRCKQFPDYPDCLKGQEMVQQVSDLIQP